MPASAWQPSGIVVAEGEPPAAAPPAAATTAAPPAAATSPPAAATPGPGPSSVFAAGVAPSLLEEEKEKKRQVKAMWATLAASKRKVAELETALALARGEQQEAGDDLQRLREELRAIEERKFGKSCDFLLLIYHIYEVFLFVDALSK